MQINELRKTLKAIGFNVRTRRNSLGIFVRLTDSEGNSMPTIFHGDEREYWQPAIDAAAPARGNLYRGDEKILFN